MSPRGAFITLEGIDGTGKTAQFRLLVAYLRRAGYGVCATREPGGTPTGEQVRRVLLAQRSRDLAPLAELVLMYAARAQHLEQIIRPALARGEVVVSDRFNDASLAYQGYARGLGVRVVRALDRLICGRTQPQLTLLLDLDPKIALSRANAREARGRGQQARFEAEGLEFQERVRAGYLALAHREPGRVKLVRANRAIKDVQADIRQIVDSFLARRGVRRGI